MLSVMYLLVFVLEIQFPNFPKIVFMEIGYKMCKIKLQAGIGVYYTDK